MTPDETELLRLTAQHRVECLLWLAREIIKPDPPQAIREEVQAALLQMAGQ